MIYLTLQDLIDDIDEVIDLVKSNKDEDFIMLINNDNKREIIKPPFSDQKAVVKFPSFAGDKIGERGFSMVELIIASTIITLVMLVVGTLNLLVTNSLLVVQNKRMAENYTKQLISSLKAGQKADFPAGGAFQTNSVSGMPARNSSGEVDLSCTKNFCDKIYIADSSAPGTQATEKVVSWDESSPAGYTWKFTRAWRISDEDEARNWRKITIAVFSAESKVPLTQTVSGGVMK